MRTVKDQTYWNRVRHQNIVTVNLSSTLQLRACKHHSKDGNSCTEENSIQIDGEEDSSESAEEDKDNESQSSKDFRETHNYSDSKSQPFSINLRILISFPISGSWKDACKAA